MLFPGFLRQDFAVWADEVSREIANGAMKSLVRQSQPETNAHLINDPLPAVESILDLPDVIVAEPFIQGRQCWHILGDNFLAYDFRNGINRVDELMIVLEFGFPKAPFQSASEVVGRV